VAIWQKKPPEDGSSMDGVSGKSRQDDALAGRAKLLTNWLVLQRYQKNGFLRQFALLTGR
jgi:hypothetical protein